MPLSPFVLAAIGFGASNGFTLPELLSLIVAFYFAYGPVKRLGGLGARQRRALRSRSFTSRAST